MRVSYPPNSDSTRQNLIFYSWTLSRRFQLPRAQELLWRIIQYQLVAEGTLDISGLQNVHSLCFLTCQLKLMFTCLYGLGQEFSLCSSKEFFFSSQMLPCLESETILKTHWGDLVEEKC